MTPELLFSREKELADLVKYIQTLGEALKIVSD
jgi:hypothetical protein